MSIRLKIVIFEAKQTVSCDSPGNECDGTGNFFNRVCLASFAPTTFNSHSKPSKNNKIRPNIKVNTLTK